MSLPRIRRRVVFVLPALAVLLLYSAVLTAAEPKQTVKLVIDYGDGVEKHFTALPWREGMTVLDAMQAAQKHSHGIRFKHTGSGATAFLTSIDDVTNQGGGGKNWVFRVNGKLATRSFGVQKLTSGDEVNWTFGTYGEE